MTKTLVVYVHPVEGSFTSSVRDAVIDFLTTQHHEVRLRDLYAENFDPFLSAAERALHHTPPTTRPELARDVEDLRWCEAIVFVYPTWWSGLPAQLKGWLDRVFVLGVAFRFNNNGKIRPNMQNVRYIIGISTYGSPWRYVKLINDNGRRTLTRAIRMSTGLRTRTIWCGIYALDTCTQHQREKFIVDTTQKIVKRLESPTPK